jgi:hypothetical protein
VTLQRFLAALLAGLGVSAGDPLLLVDGPGDGLALVGVAGTLAVGMAVGGIESVELGAAVGAMEGTGATEDSGLGVLIVSGTWTAGDGTGDETGGWLPANEAVPIP